MPTYLANLCFNSIINKINKNLIENNARSLNTHRKMLQKSLKAHHRKNILANGEGGNMKRDYVISIVLLSIAIIALTSFAPITPVKAAPQYGPREDEMIIKFYSDVEAAYRALKADEIHMVMYDITAELYYDAIEDPEIQLASLLDYGMYEIDINNNYTIPTYPGVRNPFHLEEFRKAVAHLVDKDKVIEEFCKGFAARIDVPVAAPTDPDWVNQSVSGDNYPYPYDPWAAKDLLDSAGFLPGSTPNPHYDPDTSPEWASPKIRTYPSDWDGKAGEDLDPIVACVRTDDLRRYYTGMDLVWHLQQLGIPVDLHAGTMADLYGKVMGAFDYHFYTGGWGLGRYPTYIYSLYNGMFWYPWAPNYVTGVDKDGNPNYPDIDEWSAKIWYAESMEDAKIAAKKAEGLLVEHCVCIWLWSSKSYWAYRDLLGVVNSKLAGLENQYTFNHVWTTDGQTLTVGLITPPYQLNILMSSWVYDRQVLDRIYDGFFAMTAAYAPARDQAWTVQDWAVSYWIDPKDGENKTCISIWARKDVNWVFPVNGSVYGPFTMKDLAFSIWLALNWPKSWTHDDLVDIQWIKIIDDYSAEVYFGDKSYWFQYVPMTYVIPSELWKDLGFADINRTTLTLPDPIPDNKTIHLRDYGGEQILEVIAATLDGVPLEENVDFRVVNVYDDHTYIEFLTSVTPGQNFTITYWSPGKNPDGYFPGELDWQDVMVGLGQWYMVSHEPGPGGYVGLKANRNHWLETSPKGEVDWWWEWGDRDETRPTSLHPEGPRTGHFHVGIADVVMCTGCYATTGNLVPDINWRPGADVALPECEIDISDVVTITGVYCTEFGHPP